MREQRFATPHPVRLECSVTAGEITVSTADQPESVVTLGGPPELVDAVQVELIGERLVVSEPRNSFLELLTRRNHSLSVVASLPPGSAIVSKTASSDATLDGTFGEIEMQSASADLRVTGEINGAVRVKSASGDVQLPRVHGDLHVHTISGDLRAESVDGSVSVTAVSGDVRIGSLREGAVSLRSVSGDVVLGVEPGSAVDLDASSVSGELTSEVPLSSAPAEGGGPTVVIRAVSTSGDLRVVRSSAAPVG